MFLKYQYSTIRRSHHLAFRWGVARYRIPHYVIHDRDDAAGRQCHTPWQGILETCGPHCRIHNIIKKIDKHADPYLTQSSSQQALLIIVDKHTLANIEAHTVAILFPSLQADRFNGPHHCTLPLPLRHHLMRRGCFARPEITVPGTWCRRRRSASSCCHRRGSFKHFELCRKRHRRAGPTTSG